MILVRASEPFTCVAATLSMVTSKPLEDIIRELFTGLPHPFPTPWSSLPKVPCMTEICEWAWTTAKIGLVPFDRCPTCSVAPECPPVAVWSDGESRWLKHLSFGPGLLEGIVRGDRGHMCAWDGQVILDPRGYKYTWDDRHNYKYDAHRFWLVV
jgi:hypothetical protein